MDSTANITLSRLLSRLDATLSSPENPPPPSTYEINKTSKNIDTARTLLLTLEKQSATIRIQNQRQQAQADLQRKREVIKRLSARLQELEEAAEEEEDSEDESDEGDVDERRGMNYGPARTDTDSGLDTGQTPAMQAQVVSQQAETDQQAQLRSRRPLQQSDNRSAASTTARDQLFSGRQTQPANSNLSQSEQLLSHNRTEQETLTTSLLGLASALKQSSLQFSSSLETEKDTLKRAEGGLHKSAQGMEAAERKMGTLRRMSEGQGWLGRLKLYGMIGGLWVAVILLVFVGPKIRL